MNNEILIEKKSNYATISLNRPPANSYYKEYLEQITSEIQKLNEDSKIKVIVIRSTSEKFFCAGADIKIFSKNTSNENAEMVVAARNLSDAITSNKKIFIAAINGHILGGGLELAMACDIRLASDGNYLVGLSEVKLGLMPGNGGTPRLIDLIGTSRAMEMLVTGNSINSAQAYQFGLCNQLFAKAEFEEKVTEYAENLAKGASEAMATIKKYVQRHKGMDAEYALNYETECVNKLYDTYDAKEGFQAFVEKRTPDFK